MRDGLQHPCCVTYHSPRNVYKLIPLPDFFVFVFVIFYGNLLGPPIFFVRKSSNQNQLTSPDRCGVFCFFGGGGLENIFCNFYEINSSQAFFLYCKDFGVDGSWNVLSREPSGDRIARSCLHTAPDLTIKTEVQDRIAKC